MTRHRLGVRPSLRSRYPKCFWQKVLPDFEVSRLTPRDFCNHSNLALSTFFSGRRRLRKAAASKPGFSWSGFTKTNQDFAHMLMGQHATDVMVWTRHTDMRKSIDGSCLLVSCHMDENPCSEKTSLFPDMDLMFNEPEIAVSLKEDTPKKKPSGGRKPLPKDLPREDIIHDLDADEKQCKCGHALHNIREEVSEQLETSKFCSMCAINIDVKAVKIRWFSHLCCLSLFAKAWQDLDFSPIQLSRSMQITCHLPSGTNVGSRRK